MHTIGHYGSFVAAAFAALALAMGVAVVVIAVGAKLLSHSATVITQRGAVYVVPASQIGILWEVPAMLTGLSFIWVLIALGLRLL